MVMRQRLIHLARLPRQNKWSSYRVALENPSVGSLDAGGVKFMAYPEDLAPRHVHGVIGGSEVLESPLPDVDS